MVRGLDFTTPSDSLQTIDNSERKTNQAPFLVDSLDECDGDHEELAELFNEMVVGASNYGHGHYIKICVSSRPWVGFKENFEGCPKLCLQDLTFHDIKKFVTEKFLASRAFTKLAVREPKSTSQLIEKMVMKAEGVCISLGAHCRQRSVERSPFSQTSKSGTPDTAQVFCSSLNRSALKRRI